ncbi:MAG TPA: ATP-dependent RNA helicase, partial [Gammaproteobacteria bacterium]|nr:ATP-dependent RNA helicase [Gammaproteobacteria bacterium]
MDPLPIDAIRADFDAALAHGNVVVEAATGSGKSTRLPLWCAEQGRVLVVEPRRMAARSLARHVAHLQGTEVGAGVGYAVRFDA